MRGSQGSSRCLARSKRRCFCSRAFELGINGSDVSYQIRRGRLNNSADAKGIAATIADCREGVPRVLSAAFDHVERIARGNAAVLGQEDGNLGLKAGRE
jgi:hypothetical protein